MKYQHHKTLNTKTTNPYTTKTKHNQAQKTKQKAKKPPCPQIPSRNEKTNPEIPSIGHEVNESGTTPRNSSKCSLFRACYKAAGCDLGIGALEYAPRKMARVVREGGKKWRVGFVFG